MPGMAGRHPTLDELRELVCFTASEAARGPDDGGRRSGMLRGMVELMRDCQRTGRGENGRYDRDTPEREVHVRWAAVFGALVTHADRLRARKATAAEVVADMRDRFGLGVDFAFSVEAPDFDPEHLRGRGAKTAARRVTAELMRRAGVSGSKQVPTLWARAQAARAAYSAWLAGGGPMPPRAEVALAFSVEQHLRGEAEQDPREVLAYALEVLGLA